MKRVLAIVALMLFASTASAETIRFYLQATPPTGIGVIATGPAPPGGIFPFFAGFQLDNIAGTPPTTQKLLTVPNGTINVLVYDKSNNQLVGSGQFVPSAPVFIGYDGVTWSVSN